MNTKIVLIGAGSAAFSLNLIRDFCLTPNLAGCQITLMDINAERLHNSFHLCRRYAEEVDIHINLEETTDRRQALAEADIVINCALAAGHQRLREGWAIARKHGYRMGGSLHVMHDEAFWINFYQFNLFEKIIQDILDVCPKAYYIQIANPVLAGITYLGRKYPQARIVGLCHGYEGVYHLAEILGSGRQGLNFEIPGVNHFVFLTRLAYNGRNLLPQIDYWRENEAAQQWHDFPKSSDIGPKSFDLHRRLGYYPIGDTATPGGGAWPWWYHSDNETEESWCEDPEGWYDSYFTANERKITDIRNVVSDPSTQVTEVFKPKKSGELTMPMIESLVCDIPRVIICNLPNQGEFIPGIPKNFAVEIQALVSQNGIHGIRSSELPQHLLAYIYRDRLGPVEMELAAYAQGNKQYLLQLVLMDPWTRSIAQAEALLEEILSLPYHSEMERHYQ